MPVYLIATAFTLIFASLAHGKNNVKQTTSKYVLPRKPFRSLGLFAILSSIPLTLVAAVRHEVGTDYALIFRPMFINYSRGGINEAVEIGFEVIIWTILRFTTDYIWLFAVIAILISYFAFRGIYEQSNNVVFSLLIFVLGGFYFFSLNGIRQALAIAIFFYALKYMRSRQLIKYLLMIALATTIHASSVVFIAYYWLYNIKITPKKASILLMSCILAIPFIRYIFIAILAMTRYAHYIGGRFDVASMTYADFILALPLLFLGYFYYNRAREDKMYNLLMTLQLFSLIVAIYSPMLILAFRVQVFFTSTQLFLVPLIVSYEEDKKMRMFVSLMLLCLYSAYFVWGFMVLGWSHVLPYQTIFSR